MAEIERLPLNSGLDAFSRDLLADNCPCAVCQASSPDRSGPRVITGLTPNLDESLIGLLARTSGRNWLPSMRAILATTTSTWHVHYNLAVRDDIDFSQLAYACRLAPHEVEERRYKRVELTQFLPGVNYHGAIIPAYDLELKPRRMCSSWARAAYHSAFAHHGLVTHCPVSGEILLDSCPRCRTKFKWTQSEFRICHNCGLNLVHTVGEAVPAATRDATQLILDVIHPHPKRHAQAMAKLHPLLARLDRGTVFEVGWRMGCVLTGHGLSDRDRAVQLPLETRLTILTAGSKVLANWPGSVTEALKGKFGNPETSTVANAKGIAQIANAKNAWPALKLALRQAAPGLTAGALSAVKSSLVDGVNSGEIAQVLGVGQKVIERLRVTPDLRPVFSVGSINSHHVFEAAGLASLKKLIDDRISIGAIAERLDVSHHGIGQLACLKEIQIYDSEAMRSGFVQRQAKRSDFQDLLDRLINAAQNAASGNPLDSDSKSDAPRGPGLTMHAAMKAIGGREKPWGPVILAMLSGELPFQLDRTNEGRFMSRVTVARADLHKLVSMSFDEGEFPGFDFEPSINGRDAEELLNIYPKTMQAAKLEEVIPVSVKGLYDRVTIRELAALYVSSAEVLARCTGKGRGMPPPFTGPERLIKASALGYLREVAEAAVLAHDHCRRADGHAGPSSTSPPLASVAVSEASYCP